MNIKVNEVEFFKDVTITWSKHRQQFYSHAKLIIDNHEIEIPSMYFDTLDEAVISIKERIVEASLKFKPAQAD